MNVAFLHYHLNRGGVTQVIFNQLAALDQQLTHQRGRAAIFFSGRHDAWLEQLNQFRAIDVSFCPLACLDYDWSKAQPRPDLIGGQIIDRLQELGFAPEETVVHSHNHALGLNVSLPGALLWIAERGYPVLFQLHDFAEDFRPYCFQRAVVASKAARKFAQSKGRDAAGKPLASDLPEDFDTSFCYPQGPHLHYAVINSRDYRSLGQAGIPEDRLHLLPNPVAEPQDGFPREAARKRLHSLLDIKPDEQYVLYPVRCIRRKNVGEAVLWAALAPDDTTLGLTLPPENPVCAAAYESWKQLAQSYSLRCHFEVGKEGGLRYPENIAAADLLLTTSLVEGFGMVYLESWLTDHMLTGRDLPEITGDFVQSGLALDCLRPHLPIHLDWLGEREVGDMLLEGYQRVLRDYGLDPHTNGEKLARRIQQRLDEGIVDFGELNEELQATVVERCVMDSASRSQLEELNPEIGSSLRNGSNGSSATIQQNAETVRSGFGLKVGGRRLYDAYQRILSSERTACAQPLSQPGKLLEQYLDADRYRPIAT